MSEYISSHLQAYKDAGWLADGLANNRYVSGVGTNLLSTIIAGAYECGIRDFDTKTAYEACLKNELEGKNRPFGAGKVSKISLNPVWNPTADTIKSFKKRGINEKKYFGHKLNRNVIFCRMR